MKDGFEEVSSLDCEVAITLGGTDKKTGKANATELEGYYLGAKQVPSAYAKSGTSPLHIFLTPNGNVGVWGKSRLNKKLATVTPGQYAAVEFTGMKTLKGFPPLYDYKVGVRKGDVIDVASVQAEASDVGQDDEGLEDADIYSDNAPSAATAHATVARTASPPTASQQARARAMLSGTSRKS